MALPAVTIPARLQHRLRTKGVWSDAAPNIYGEKRNGVFLRRVDGGVGRRSRKKDLTMGKRKKMTSREIIDEFERTPEIKTPLELKSFLHCGDEGIREITKLIAALCRNQGKWQEVFVADWTLYPKDECHDVKPCLEAEALENVLKEYDAIVSPDAPAPRWLFLRRYSRPPVNEEKIKGTKKFNDYFLNVPYETSKINLEQDSATAARFAQYAEEGRYSEVEDGAALRDSSEKGPQPPEEDVPEDCDSNEERRSVVVFDSRFRVKRDAFASALSRVAKCVSKTSDEPFERYVKVVANDNGIFLSATDGDFSALEKIVDPDDFRVLISGAFLVDPDDLTRLFSKTPGRGDEMLVFALHFSFLTIKGARFRYRFFVEDAFIPSVRKDPSVGFERQEDVRINVEQEIPEFCEDRGYYEMKSEELKRTIRRALGAVDMEYETPESLKFAFSFEEEEATAAARGYLTVAWQRSPSRFVGEPKADSPFWTETVQISAKALERLESFLGGPETVQIAFSGERAQVRTEKAFLTFRADLGNYFPSLRFFVNLNRPAPEGELFAGDLATALRCVLGNEKWSNRFDEFPVTLEMRNKRLVLARGRRIMAPPVVEIPLRYVGNRTSVVLNARRLHDLVDMLLPEEPVVIRAYGADALFETRDGFQFLVNEAEGVPF